jgi:hypothetical protein
VRVEDSPNNQAGDDRYSAFFGTIGPQLYQTNPFRVLGLSVEATVPEIRRRVDLLQKSLTLEIAVPTKPSPLPLDVLPTSDLLLESLQRIRDPERRLIDELFWLWPQQPGGEDPAHIALSNGDMDSAIEFWRANYCGVGCHNLAVFSHAQALDLEMARQQRSLTLEEESRRDQLWRYALQHWRNLGSDNAFWDRFDLRVDHLNDPRFSRADAITVRQHLWLAVLSINAKLAIGARRDGRTVDANRQLEFMKVASFDGNVAEEALQLELEPQRENLQWLCREATAEAKKDPSRADEIATVLLNQAAPLLELLDWLPANHSISYTAHDQVSQTAYEVLLELPRYYQDTDLPGEPAQRGLPVLRQIKTIAVSDTLLQQLEANISHLDDFLKMGAPVVESFDSNASEPRSCWFCGQNPPLMDLSFGVMMQRGSDRTLVLVPRCRKCIKRQRRADIVSFLVFALCMLTIIVFLVRHGAGTRWWWAIIVGLFETSFIVAVFRGLMLGGSKDEDAAKKFPPVRKNKANGYKITKQAGGATS